MSFSGFILLRSGRHDDFELLECLQGLRPCFLRPDEVDTDEAGLPLQVFWLSGKLLVLHGLLCDLTFG